MLQGVHVAAMGQTAASTAGPARPLLRGVIPGLPPAWPQGSAEESNVLEMKDPCTHCWGNGLRAANYDKLHNERKETLCLTLTEEEPLKTPSICLKLH